MLIHYLILGVGPDADDAEIRNRYLDLVKRHPPEKEPVRFQEITSAYEAIKDVRKRLSARYIPPMSLVDAKSEILAMATTLKRKRRRVGLKDLIRESVTGRRM